MKLSSRPMWNSLTRGPSLKSNHSPFAGVASPYMPHLEEPTWRRFQFFFALCYPPCAERAMQASSRRNPTDMGNVSMRRWTAVQCRAKREILEAPSTRGPGLWVRATDAGQLRATIQHHPNGLPESCPIHSVVPFHPHTAWPPMDPMASIIRSPALEMATPNPGSNSPV